MRIYKTETKEVEQITDICCDKCGRSCMGHCGNFCGIHFSISGGFDSSIFPDDETVREYDVCEYCANDWMRTWPKDYLTINTNTGSVVTS